MIQYRIPIRNNTPQQIGPYTFKDQNGVIIPLTGFSSAMLELKLQGQVFATVGATILNAPAGQVQVTSFTFTQLGTWDAQFFCVDNSGNKLYGEPIQLQVVANVDDLSLSQLASY